MIVWICQTALVTPLPSFAAIYIKVKSHLIWSCLIWNLFRFAFNFSAAAPSPFCPGAPMSHTEKMQLPFNGLGHMRAWRIYVLKKLQHVLGFLNLLSIKCISARCDQSKVFFLFSFPSYIHDLYIFIYTADKWKKKFFYDCKLSIHFGMENFSLVLSWISPKNWTWKVWRFSSYISLSYVLWCKLETGMKYVIWRKSRKRDRKKFCKLSLHLKIEVFFLSKMVIALNMAKVWYIWDSHKISVGQSVTPHSGKKYVPHTDTRYGRYDGIKHHHLFPSVHTNILFTFQSDF
jgi:hypothetical protein